MVRDARPEDFGRINEIRREVNRLHAEGRPDFFRGDFSPEMERITREYVENADRRGLVAERDGEVAGIALIEYIKRPATPYMQPRNFLHVTEFGVGSGFRRQGVGRELFDFLKADAAAHGCTGVELDMWTFNEDAQAFYEAMGMTPTRIYLEYNLQNPGRA